MKKSSLEFYCILLIENTHSLSWEVLFPDFPGLFCFGRNINEALENAKNGLIFHIEGLLLSGQQIPFPKAIYEIAEEHNTEKSLIRFISIDVEKITKTVKQNIDGE